MFGAFQTFGKLGAAAGRTLAQQIAAMAPSLWLEPSVTNGYQDSAGTTALTQPGGGSADPPVGLALDLSGLGNHALQATSTARPKLSARVNLLTYTEDFSNATWPKTNATVSANSAIAPNGTLTAAQLIESLDGGSSVHLLNRKMATIGVQQTLSVYAKAGERTQIALQLGADAAYFNLSTGVVVSASGSISNAGNGWWRCSFSSTPANTNSLIYTAVSGSASYVGDGASGVYLWGAQLELGSNANTYQAVTDANTYAYTGWPLIHQFDGVDDVLNVTFPSSLGSDCTVVTANRGTTPTILTGQTIGTSYTITATNAGRLVFPRALTAAETAIVTKWATQKGALP